MGGDSSFYEKVTRKKRGRSPKSDVGSSKKSKKSSVSIDMSSREFTKDLLWDENFMKEFKLTKVIDWLKKQKWDKLIQGEHEYNPLMVKMFYENLVIEDIGNMTIGTCTIDKKTYSFTSKDVSDILEIPHEGFAEYYKGGWPEGVDDREIIKTVTDSDDNFTSPYLVSKMGIEKKVMFNYLITNLLPRELKRNATFIQDLLVMDKIIRGKKVNMP